MPDKKTLRTCDLHDAAVLISVGVGFSGAERSLKERDNRVFFSFSNENGQADQALVAHRAGRLEMATLVYTTAHVTAKRMLREALNA